METKNKKQETVNKFTRSGKNGKAIYCPNCDKQTIVYDFAWSGTRCQKCNTMIYKNEWKLKN
jgi:ribosomal protein S27E